MLIYDKSNQPQSTHLQYGIAREKTYQTFPRKPVVRIQVSYISTYHVSVKWLFCVVFPYPSVPSSSTIVLQILHDTLEPLSVPLVGTPPRVLPLLPLSFTGTSSKNYRFDSESPTHSLPVCFLPLFTKSPVPPVKIPFPRSTCQLICASVLSSLYRFITGYLV